MALALALAVLPAACAASRPVQIAERAAPAASASPRLSGEAVASYLRGRVAERSGDSPAALEAFDAAILHDPSSASLRIAYARALLRMGDAGGAARAAARALERAKSPRDQAEAHLLLAQARVALDLVEPTVVSGR